MSFPRTHQGDACGDRTQGLSIQSPRLYHYATALPRAILFSGSLGILENNYRELGVTRREHSWFKEARTKEKIFRELGRKFIFLLVSWS